MEKQWPNPKNKIQKKNKVKQGSKIALGIGRGIGKAGPK